MFVNQAGDCAICDICVLALFPMVQDTYSAGNPYDRPEGKPN